VTDTVAVNGVRIAYRFDGPPGGRVVLMSNSLMSSYDMWDWTVPAFADRYRVLRYDTRGHGRSATPPGPYSIASLGDEAAGLLDALGIEAAHFVGLSMGGMVGQQLGARYPGKVLSLSLCDTASEMPPREMWEERLAIAASKGIPGLAEGTLKRWFTEPFIRRAPGDVEKVRGMILGTGVEGYMACAGAIRDMAQTTMLLAITAPTLVLTGRQDPATTVAHATVLHRVIAGSRLVIIEDAAHLSNIEQPRAFNAALRAFIDEIDGGLPAA
jgi:3-oxoadipate enol-lactonase